MKLGGLASVPIMIGAIVGSAAGHPLNLKRAIVTEVVFVTETVADTIIYVDEHGDPYLTTKVGRSTNIPLTMAGSTSVLPVVPTKPAATTSFPSFATSVPPSSVDFEDAVSEPVGYSSRLADFPSSFSSPGLHTSPSVEVLEPPSSLPTPDPMPSSKTAGTSMPFDPKPSTSSESRFPLGITYDPFKGVPGQCQCKSADEMAAEFESLKEYGIIRIYGNDCDVIPAAIQQAKKNGQKLMGGIYTPNQDIKGVVDALSDAVRRYNGGNWDIISLVSVENERVNARVITVSDAHDSITQARRALSNAGYSGPIGAVETVPAVVDNPALCEKSDMTLVNIHAFFDPNTKAENAGEFVKSEVARVQKACPSKRVVVTESGWPWQGTNHDQAVVSREAQRAAIKSIRAAFDHDMFLFNAYDSPWKTDDPSTWNSERYWGIM